MKVWFITGASRGFGALITEKVLAQGDAVVATSRSIKAITDRFGSPKNLLALPLDVTREDQAIAAAKAAIEHFGKIDVLLNNAGFGLLGAVEEATEAEVEAVYKTNVFGVLNVTRAVLPYMRKAKSGRILNISSIGGYRGAAGFGVYSSTKFAVEGLSEALHAELMPLNIYVTVVEPGYFRTDFLDVTSLSTSPVQISDYDATVGKVRRAALELNHSQPGDPSKLASVLVSFIDTPNPPVRLPLGSDTVAAIEKKHIEDAEIIAKWRETSISTDF
ncbi:SDR family NAD(P)-dependent oxidoreductase [Acinetobacter lactucae]|uniref:SDR family NAD(P)-dependent oxidoreductase n=1 Tax=Acinetobacter lactucae TaxID=1785128 RepID=UPI00358DD628